MGMAFYPADGKTVTELMPWAHPMHPSAPGTRKAHSTCLSAHIRLQQGLLGCLVPLPCVGFSAACCERLAYCCAACAFNCAMRTSPSDCIHEFA